MSMKEILLLVLPFIIFSFLYSSVCGLQKGAVHFVVLLFSMVCISNFLSTMAAYGVGLSFLPNMAIMAMPAPNANALQPLWNMHLPKLISNDTAMLMAVTCGFISIRWMPTRGQEIAEKLVSASMFFLKRLFLPLMPLFIFGFAAKLAHDGMLALIFQDYFRIILIIIGAQCVYLCLAYGAITMFNPSKWIESMRNMLPAVIAGFSSMSSAAAMPATLVATERNCGNKEVARATVPVTLSIHLVGDCFAIPIVAMGLMLSFGMDLPDLSQYLLFAFSFVLAKFAVAAVPGGGILVMLPVLEKTLGFSPEMLSLITTLYILFDPAITSVNILGNGAFAMYVSRAYQWVRSGANASTLPQA
jgi:Na+/H+-dicarboxylate symporter